MSAVSRYFRAFSDQTRLRLMRVLGDFELSVNELVQLFGMGQSRISRHLKILVEAGLLRRRRDGLLAFYSAVEEGPAGNFLAAVSPFLKDGDFGRADSDMVARIMEERALGTRRFFNAVAEDWDALNREVLEGFDLAGAVCSALPPHCGCAVDLGCGTGMVLSRLRPHARELIGVDDSPRMLELARRRFAGSGRESPPPSLRIGGLEHLPLRDAEADFACINLVLHHLSDPLAALKETRRVLKRGGRLFVSDFDRHDNELMRAKYRDRRLGFDESALRGMLDKAGFAPGAPAQRQPVGNHLTLLLIPAEAV
jgi:ArsR family transcriptional regulator